jgi:hypothetical protein
MNNITDYPDNAKWPELVIRFPLVLIGCLFWFAGYAYGIFVVLFKEGHKHSWND